MNGLEACNLIYNYLNGIGIRLSNSNVSLQDRLNLRVSKTLIYCLTSDFSPQVMNQIADYPFKRKINQITNEEGQKILKEIMNMHESD